MKPLTLTIHPRLEDANLNPDEIRQGRVTTLALMKTKRLTAAELAAEWWRHHASFDQLTEGYGVESFGTDYICGGMHEDRARGQLNTLRRFATTPHYFEEAA